MISPESIALWAGVASTIVGLGVWFKTSIEAQYAFRRDYGHLLKAYDTLAHNVATLSEMLDDRLDEMKDVEIERSHQLNRGILELRTGQTSIRDKLSENNSLLMRKSHS